MKKLISMLLIALMVVCVCGCGVTIEDNNGADNYELATLTEDNIIKMDTGASSYKSSTSGNSSYTKYSSKDFSGVEEIYTSTYTNSDVIIDLVDYKIDGGNFKLVVVCDDEIIHTFEPTDTADICTLKDISGALSVRMAGESAAFEFKIDIW